MDFPKLSAGLDIITLRHLKNSNNVVTVVEPTKNAGVKIAPNHLSFKMLLAWLHVYNLSSLVFMMLTNPITTQNVSKLTVLFNVRPSGATLNDMK